RLDQRRRVERAVAEAAGGVRSMEEAAVVREAGERDVAGALDAGVEVAVTAAAERGVRARVAVARVAAAGGEEHGPAGLRAGVGHHDRREIELVGAAELAHEQVDAIELAVAGEPEVLAGGAVEAPGVVLDDRAGL